MHLDFAVVADYALVDQAGKISVLGIFQHIWVQQFPAMHPRLHLVLRLKGKRTEIEAAAVLVFDVPFPHPGVYRFDITVDGERAAQVPITVSQMPQPESGTPR